ncbi:MAG: pantetheine-phosphate adenylyltransferase [Eubacteriales bacterium]|nr:pantetheine-phosphate adenylyltransferase [Eubacteriales bacterium]
MKIAVYPGTFDPLTNGHVDVALRAKKIFDKVIIMVAANSKKGNHFFTTEERVELAKEVFSHYEGFEVVSTDGLVVKAAKDLGAQALIRGLRAVTDYEMEVQMHEVNEYIEPDIDMVYLMSHRDQAFVSSTNIKELFHYGEDISHLVPKEVLDAMKKKVGRE